MAEAGSSPLGTALGLDAAELELLGELFAEAAGALGIEGRPVFRRLAAGAPLKEALGLPAGTEQVLYARAHRWFAAGRPDRAEPLFHALCLLDGSDADAWVGYGICLKLRSALPDAAMAFEVAGRLRPDWPIPDFHALETALRGGDRALAAEHLARFDRKTPGGVDEAIRTEVDRWRAALAPADGALRAEARG